MPDPDWEELTRRECKLQGEWPKTFTISADGKSITCLRCKRTSHNPNDVEQEYCGNCKMFHDDVWPPARQWWIDNPAPLDLLVRALASVGDIEAHDLMQLDDDERQILYSRFVDGKSFVEIGRVVRNKTKSNPATRERVRQRLNVALRKLRRKLAKLE